MATVSELDLLSHLSERPSSWRSMCFAKELERIGSLCSSCLSFLFEEITRPSQSFAMFCGQHALPHQCKRLLRFPPPRPWRPTARRAARAHAEMHDAEATAPSTSDSEIRAQGVLAWCAVRLGHLRCAWASTDSGTQGPCAVWEGCVVSYTVQLKFVC